MKNKGVWSAVLCYVIWGFFPIYWKALSVVPAVQIVAHRLIWSLVFLVGIIFFTRHKLDWKAILVPRVLLIYLLAGTLLTVNWLVYVWGVNTGRVVETSLGYFINPLVSVLFGVLFFGEKLPLSKWLPIGLAAVGVIYLSFEYGALPWVSLALALSFGSYGLVKKKGPLGVLPGLTLETAVIFVPAMAYLIFVETQGSGAYGHVPPYMSVMLMFGGVVTAIPLLLFSSAARSIPLSTIGILQYITPTSQFLLGVFLYHEAFPPERLIGFGMIWVALALFSMGGLYERRKAMRLAVAASPVDVIRG